jgi:hypothetical protein
MSAIAVYRFGAGLERARHLFRARKHKRAAAMVALASYSVWTLALVSFAAASTI